MEVESRFAQTQHAFCVVAKGPLCLAELSPRRTRQTEVCGTSTSTSCSTSARGVLVQSLMQYSQLVPCSIRAPAPISSQLHTRNTAARQKEGKNIDQRCASVRVLVRLF